MKGMTVVYSGEGAGEIGLLDYKVRGYTDLIILKGFHSGEERVGYSPPLLYHNTCTIAMIQ